MNRLIVKRLALAVLVTLSAGAVSAQEGRRSWAEFAPNTASDWRPPRTEFGHPDMQGTWLFGSRTPLQRPMNRGNQRSYTPAEAAAIEQRLSRRNQMQDAPLDPNRDAPEAGAVIRQEADDTFLAHLQRPELVPVSGEYRTSVIVDPPDGRIPRREDFQDYHAQIRAAGLGNTDGPEGQPLSGRCVMFGGAVPNLTPIMMNPNLQIVQIRDYVMIMTEMVHDARIIRLDAEHFEHDIPRWMGDSVGRWENDTLVVQTLNFRPEQSSSRGFPVSGQMEIEERYTLVADDQILYSFTVTDPEALTQPVTGERMMLRNAPEEKIYEFACHEGNYSLDAILRGARRQEVDAEFQ